MAPCGLYNSNCVRFGCQWHVTFPGIISCTLAVMRDRLTVIAKLSLFPPHIQVHVYLCNCTLLKPMHKLHWQWEKAKHKFLRSCGGSSDSDSICRVVKLKYSNRQTNLIFLLQWNNYFKVLYILENAKWFKIYATQCWKDDFKLFVPVKQGTELRSVWEKVHVTLFNGTSLQYKVAVVHHLLA